MVEPDSHALRRPTEHLLHGTLDALILKTLALGRATAMPIARFIEDTTGDGRPCRGRSFYPALYRLERRGWVEAEWGVSELGRRAKLYQPHRRRAGAQL